MKNRIFVLICSIAFLGAACGGAQLPDENYAPEQTIAAAQERQPDENPEAKLHLKLAQDQVAEAQKLKEEGEEDKARMMLMKAQADADYALALLRRADAVAEAEEVQEKVRELRAEVEKGAETPTEPATSEEK